jgi:hypothetical protein
MASPRTATSLRSRFWSRAKWIAAWVTVFVVLAAVGIVVGLVTRQSGSNKGNTSAPATSAPARFFGAFGAMDDFDRSDSSTSLGTSQSGQAWVAVVGTWGVKDHQAYVVKPKAKGYSLAVLNMYTGDGSVQVTMSKIAAGSGLVFLYRNVFNYWMMTASPKVATWVVQKFVDGKLTTVGGIGVAPIKDGTVIGVEMGGGGLSVSVNGQLRRTFRDGDLQGEPRVGLVGFAKAAGTARWSNFVALGQAPAPTSTRPATTSTRPAPFPGPAPTLTKP